jgi:uncharacterized protein YndB with AHSA1/START domain
MEFKFKVHTKIQKPVAEVFDAVYNPQKLSQYFTSGGADAPLKEATTVHWAFSDVPAADGPSFVRFPVVVKKVIPEQLIQLEWESSEGGYDNQVEIRFETLGPSETLVTISEGIWKSTEKGLASSYGNCGGWMQMLCCLKGFTEYGINLRKGAV